MRVFPAIVCILSTLVWLTEGRLSHVFAVSRHSLKSVDYTKEFATRFNVTFTMTPGKPGTVTPHGLKFAKLVGEYLRQQYGAQLLPKGATCEGVEAAISITADTDARDVNSGKSLLEGFAPDCNLAPSSGRWAHALIQEGKSDMLYPGCPYASQEEVEDLLGYDVDDWVRTNFGSTMAEISELVGCCKPSQCPKGKCGLLDVPNRWVGGYWETWKGGWSTASHIAVILQSQYLNNMSVFGDVPPEKITQYYAVATAYWNTYKNGINKNRFGGTLAAHILQVLMDAAEGSKAGPRLQWFMGHDVNFAFMAEFLELSTSTRSYPHGASSIFLGGLLIELHLPDAGEAGPTVRVFQQAATMSQIRHLSIRWGEEEMERSAVPVIGCSVPLDCPVDEFATYLARRIESKCVDPTNQPVLDLLAKARMGSSEGVRTTTHQEVSAAAIPIIIVILVVAAAFLYFWVHKNSKTQPTKQTIAAV